MSGAIAAPARFWHAAGSLRTRGGVCVLREVGWGIGGDTFHASAGRGGNGTCRVPVTKQEPPWVVKDAATAAATLMIMVPAASLKIGHGDGRRQATDKKRDPNSR